ncbi:MAG: DNA repair protein RadA [Gammaproteobacteria bacterium]|nr:MAG: DNA repair protein RadA [Gammaproteobacteria bacterium]
MAVKQAFQCRECGATAPKWSGRCGDCGAWNSMEEIALARGGGRRAAAHMAGEQLAEVTDLGQADTGETPRIRSGIGELDRVLGGGLVTGSVVLIGGDPGIGKSTLLLQLMSRLQAGGLSCLYVSGEESTRQVAMRAGRLGLEVAGLRFVPETRVERILELAAKERPAAMVIDSIQTLYTEELSSAPGGVSQVRESAARLVQYAKRSGTALYLVGHVTKEGALAGPRVLEHMVDTVLYFEGDPGSRFRVVRAVKNRFGAVNELGVFAMTDKGLREVSNPSAIFLSRTGEDAAGSAVIVTREGTRPLLVEVQALVDDSQLANPRRVCVGLEQNRLAMLLAVLHRHGGVSMADRDVFVNAVGGVRISETGADLGVICAVLSSLRDAPLPRDLVVFGELGLAGEVRPVQNGPERLKEAAKHGFRRAIVPRANVPKGGVEGLEVQPVSRLGEVIDALNG